MPDGNILENLDRENTGTGGDAPAQRGQTQPAGAPESPSVGTPVGAAERGLWWPCLEALILRGEARPYRSWEELQEGLANSWALLSAPNPGPPVVPGGRVWTYTTEGGATLTVLQRPPVPLKKKNIKIPYSGFSLLLCTRMGCIRLFIRSFIQQLLIEGLPGARWNGWEDQKVGVSKVLTRKQRRQTWSEQSE